MWWFSEQITRLRIYEKNLCRGFFLSNCRELWLPLWVVTPSGSFPIVSCIIQLLYIHQHVSEMLRVIPVKRDKLYHCFLFLSRICFLLFPCKITWFFFHVQWHVFLTWPWKFSSLALTGNIGALLLTVMSMLLLSGTELTSWALWVW